MYKLALFIAFCCSANCGANLLRTDPGGVEITRWQTQQDGSSISVLFLANVPPHEMFLEQFMIDFPNQKLVTFAPSIGPEWKTAQIIGSFVYENQEPTKGWFPVPVKRPGVTWTADTLSISTASGTSCYHLQNGMLYEFTTSRTSPDFQCSRNFPTDMLPKDHLLRYSVGNPIRSVLFKDSSGEFFLEQKPEEQSESAPSIALTLYERSCCAEVMERNVSREGTPVCERVSQGFKDFPDKKLRTILTLTKSGSEGKFRIPTAPSDTSLSALCPRTMTHYFRSFSWRPTPSHNNS